LTIVGLLKLTARPEPTGCIVIFSIIVVLVFAGIIIPQVF
jgi:hypothetical protein